MLVATETSVGRDSQAAQRTWTGLVKRSHIDQCRQFTYIKLVWNWTERCKIQAINCICALYYRRVCDLCSFYIPIIHEPYKGWLSELNISRSWLQTVVEITHTVKYKFLRADNHTDSRRVNFYGALFTTMWFAGSLTVDRYLLVDSSNPNHTSIKVQVVIKSWSFCCKPKTLHTWLLFGNICAADGSDSLCEVCDTFTIMWIEILKKTKMLWNGCIARGISLEGCFAVGGDLWRWL